MNYPTVEFERPKAVVQLFSNHLDILKPQWRGGEWRDRSTWNQTLQSLAGWAEEDRVILNETILHRRDDLEASDVLLLVDVNNHGRTAHPPGITQVFEKDPDSSTRDNAAPFYFLTKWPGISVRYSAYDIARTDHGVDLHFADGGRTFIAPRRESFRITNLPKNSAIRTIVNGRVSGGEERVYRHCDDLFIYLGDFRRFEIRPWSAMPSIKHIPLMEARVINLEKDLH